MRKFYITALICGILLMFALTTNPHSKSDYADWVKEQISEEEGAFFGWIGGSIVNAATEKKNMGIFTIYETKFSENDEDRIVALGIFNNFIWIKSIPESSPE